MCGTIAKWKAFGSVLKRISRKGETTWVAVIIAALAATTLHAATIVVDADAAAFDNQDISTFFPGVTLSAVNPTGPVFAVPDINFAPTPPRVFGPHAGDTSWSFVGRPDFKATFNFLASRVSIDYISDLGGTLYAYDSNGVLLATDTELDFRGTFTVTALGIKSIMVVLVKGVNDFGSLDHMVIDTGTPFYQTRYFSNLNVADSSINMTNTGAASTTLLDAGQTGGTAQNNIEGNLCVNIYTFAADEQEVACCSCLVTPNALWSASVKTALLNSPLTPAFPNEVVVKMISTAPITGPNGTQSCNPATVNVIGTNLTPGLVAWGASVHGAPTPAGPVFQMTETPFISATLTAAELTRDVQECQFIQILGSGQFGICKGCSNVGLGAAAQ